MKKSDFEAMVDKAFWGLEAKYGFKKIETTYVDRTCRIQFENDTTAVLLNYEIGSKPWLEISDVHDTGKKSTLGWLMVELGIDEIPHPQQAFQTATLQKDQLDPALQQMGRELMEYGAEFLKGDFALMPHLQARARKYDLDCQRYLAKHKA